MLILLLVICIGLFVVGCIWEDCVLSVASLFVSIGGGIVCMVAIFLLAISFSSAQAIPNKIEVLEEQNLKIESQINGIVVNYLEHEGETYDKLTPDNAEFFAVAYPQLASNETVKKQMDVYIGNNNKITDLKLEWCNRDIYAWWLYFGGGK